ncbi:hypothetical protein LTS03_010805 [Exophiala xenobiotica]|nr:hypothetical protein LTR92_010772 [Exophiala xenobiotica]KAK5247802.1 hypothetical protein LTS06_007105 [Exophiala xenobiotica]KAK5262076.1 hypothetical protein LTR40_001006 [Exophiala xenobiotica]KAK5358521.1 hypothetical protein LTR11_010922 [Exophiala xenobiotica]KAK5359977.1 hypothetical protein LTS03_010805 [Exophiala xenobiotica]
MSKELSPCRKRNASTPRLRVVAQVDVRADVQAKLPSLADPLTTPVIAESLTSLSSKIEQDSHTLDDAGKRRIQKLARAAKRAMAGRDLLIVDNDLLREQNNGRAVRQSGNSTVVGTARIMSYADIVEAKNNRAVK